MSQITPQSYADSAAEHGAAPARQMLSPSPGAVTERPALSPNVVLIGEMPETGFKEQQWLIQRDGQFIQVTELLYRVAEHIDGTRTLEDIAAKVTDATEWMVTADNIRQLIQMKLIPLGLVATPDEPGIAPAQTAGQAQSSSPLGVNMRMKVIGPEIIDPIARVFQGLHAPLVLIPLLIAIALAHGWVYLVHGVLGSVVDVLYQPGLLLVLIAIMPIAGLFHELGHASALRYGGGKIRGMGVGLYLVYPAFYTDVTDSYRLGRWARVRTDLGGFYFYLIFALGTIILYWLTGLEFLLLLVVLINLDILYQCLPFVRFDGYWALADLTGIPDFFSQMGPFLASIMPIPGFKGSKLPDLKPWVRRVFAVYIALTIPVLALLFFLLVARVPRIMIATWDSLLIQFTGLSYAQSDGNVLGVVLLALQICVLMLPLAVAFYLLYSVIWKSIVAIWSWSKPTSTRRIIGTSAIAAIISLIAFLWTPQLSYASWAVPQGVQQFVVTESNHVPPPVAYPQMPPVGGNHASVWQNCGFYDRPVVPEHAVHSLEHGAVWITYRPDITEEQRDTLRRLARRQTYVLVSPIPDQTSPVIALAWGNQLHLDSVDDPRLNQFVRAFRLNAQAPEPGQPCTGGTGVPQ